MDASSLAEILPVWASSSGSGGVSEVADSRCGALLVAVAQLRFYRSATLLLAHKN